MVDSDYREWLREGPVELMDCRRRLWWANANGESLATAMHAFMAPTDRSYPHTIFVEIDGDRGRAVFKRTIDESDEWLARERFAQLIGQFLDNHRAALNYLAVELANLAVCENPSLADPNLGRNQQLHPDQIEFPIFAKAAKYREKNKVGKLPAKVRGAIESVQPCFGGDSGLWDLQVLSAEFRHRVVHPVAIAPVEQRFGVKLDGGFIDADFRVLTTGSPLEHDTEVMRFTIPESVPPERRNDVEPNIAICASLDHPLCASRDCIDVVNGINRAVAGVMERFEAFFTPGDHEASGRGWRSPSAPRRG